MFVPEGSRGQSGELEDSDHEEKEKAMACHLLTRIMSPTVPKADLSKLGLHSLQLIKITLASFSKQAVYRHS